jgi:hypothetical protein
MAVHQWVRRMEGGRGFSDCTGNELRDEIEAMEVALRWLIQKPLSDGERATLSLKVWAAKAELIRRDDFPALRRPSATHVSGDLSKAGASPDLTGRAPARVRRGPPQSRLLKCAARLPPIDESLHQLESLKLDFE